METIYPDQKTAQKESQKRLNNNVNVFKAAALFSVKEIYETSDAKEAALMLQREWIAINAAIAEDKVTWCLARF